MSKLEILELVVVGYKRLALKDDRSYVITPSNIHLILGTNGSGKSSLMELLTPLPPQTKDFIEDGYKKITFRYDGSVYEVYSTNNKHTMTRDGEPIIENAGINKMIELCYEYFKITPALHRFMLGKVSMSTMSLQYRKDFITSISNIDFDYVTNLYNNTRKKIRDNTAIVKHLSNKVLSMKEYILVDAEVDRLNKSKNDIKYLLTRLHENKHSSNPSLDTDMINSLSMKIDNVINYSSKLKTAMDIWNVDKAKLPYIIDDKRKELDNKKEALVDVSNKLLELSKKVDKDTANVKILEIDNELSKLLEDFTLDNELNISKDILHNLVGDAFTLKGSYSNDITNNLKEVNARYNSNLEILNNLKTTNDALSAKIDTYRSTIGKLNCPDCGFHFHNEAVDKLIEDISKEIGSNVLKINDLNKLVVDDDSTIKHYNDLINRRRAILELLEVTNINKLTSYSPSYENDLHELFLYLRRVERDINNYPRIKELRTNRENILLSVDSDDNINNKDILTNEYSKLRTIVNSIEADINRFVGYSNANERLSKDIDTIKQYLKNKHTNKINKIKDIKNQHINMIILELNNQLSTIETTLDKFSYMSKSTKEYLDEIERVKEDNRLLEILVKELSPANGLIAESIKSFLGEYIDEVNAIISKVWSYDLEILPFDVDDLDKGVTYRFPVLTRGEPNAPDINDTSESMREMINIAFRIVSLKYMGLSQFPLMIDEFGRSMDEIHLIKSYDLLERICDTQDIQMFIIAHIKACYNRFRNAGISIVSDLNLESLE